MEQKENQSQQVFQEIAYTLWIKGEEKHKDLRREKDNLHDRNCMMRVKTNKQQQKAHVSPPGKLHARW